MGHRYETGTGPIAVKLLAEPAWLMEDGTVASPHQRSIRIV
jgi:hypothetical protein